MTDTLRIGTRGSPLALAQSRQIAELLERAGAGATEIVAISTKGDARLDIALADIGGKGLFTAELEAGLRDGTIDCAVHSLKDLPTRMTADLQITAIPPRADSRDVLLPPQHWQAPTPPPASVLDTLPQGARVGTASLRRQAQLLHLRPDLRCELLRGNIGTRLNKIDNSPADAPLFAVLALCGLERQDMLARPHYALPEDIMLPAAGQGALALQSLKSHTALNELLAKLEDDHTRIETTAERAFLAELEGSCRLPIAARARIAGNQVQLTARLLAKDGTQCAQSQTSAPLLAPEQAGYRAGQEIRKTHHALLEALLD